MAGDSLRDATVPSEFARTLERELNVANAELARRHKEYATALNRRVEVEAVLIDIGAGKRDLPTREECAALAIKLGVSPASAPDASHDLAVANDLLDQIQMLCDGHGVGLRDHVLDILAKRIPPTP